MHFLYIDFEAKCLTHILHSIQQMLVNGNMTLIAIWTSQRLISIELVKVPVVSEITSGWLLLLAVITIRAAAETTQVVEVVEVVSTGWAMAMEVAEAMLEGMVSMAETQVRKILEDNLIRNRLTKPFRNQEVRVLQVLRDHVGMVAVAVG
ncbi:hypothetical protein CPB84DRAFT_241487 [Gymnopilus junonius]|uniref:Uncharacterized protein n=1 Tax=Gymnopilus junonius TaxID=109634 RepID=A0A9P5NV84_GYMJU|nr:hypothetical protein CPB84DRAFT_241487 [Gymnopilus junonius]